MFEREYRLVCAMLRHFVVVLLCLLVCVDGLWGAAAEVGGEPTHEVWSYNLGMYEVNLRHFSERGDIEGFREHLDRLQAMGVGIIWFMPIHPIGEEKKAGSLGSYYAVKDYMGFNEEFGDLDGFKRLIDEIHSRGMYVLIDWVANHTAWDNEMLKAHPAWYTKGKDGEIVKPGGTNWADVADLDFSNQALQAYMIEAMRFWVNEIGVDGFRCDAAGMVPSEFWEKAIDKLKQDRGDLLMLAEGDGASLMEAGFDMLYAWGLHGFENGQMLANYRGELSADGLGEYLLRDRGAYEDEYRLYFTSNHDENSWHGSGIEQFGEGAEVYGVLTMTVNGMPLIFNGQEAGLDRRLDFFEHDAIEWKTDRMADVYGVLLALKKRNSALFNGRLGGGLKMIDVRDEAVALRYFRDAGKDEGKVLGYVREKGDDAVLVVLNLSAQRRQVVIEERVEGEYADVFDGTGWRMGKEIVLDGWGYRVLERVRE
ncbi:Cyclomaltodextrinase [Poriferisphaera corsica]|uniref:Cyclomaltodextrinase n=1 Tax=Poriferisphaera corsica TaxID=2528020 RepID=A0A517YVC6_9BACT|nr:alpha-amylase family glycosyl hydrolase [Poriferisphaera corsica]QDU34188.1 Cyclomaltodextrinase [Poriferisphaera corsica]